MNIETISGSLPPQKDASPLATIDRQRQQIESAPEEAAAAPPSEVQPEELVQQIKALTENGTYSVRFENDDNTNDMVVKIVDPETNEVLRQIPTEELIEMMKHLKDLTGNLVDTLG